MNRQRFLFVCLVLAIGLAACQPASQSSAPTTAPTVAAADTSAAAAPTNPAGSPTSPAGSPTNPAGSTAAPTQGAAQQTKAPAPGGKPPQTGAAEIRPPERRKELTRLTALLQFQVQGLDGANLGKISDYVINTCETYIIYFVMDPAGDLKIAAGNRLIVPFEAVTINSGALDAQAKAIILHLTPDPFAGAPAFPTSLQLFPISWEDGVRTYWQQVVRVGKLSTDCLAGGGPAIHKIAYATQLLGADLKDGNHNLLGQVQEAILAPESGKLAFYVVSLSNNQGLVLVPLAKTNIPNAALQPGAKIELVLLADNKKLAGAPHISSVEQASEDAIQGAAISYWGR